MPQMFAEMAPCVVGQDAVKDFGRLDFARGGNVYQGSPKRYAWDNDPIAEKFWGMATNPWSNQFTASPTVRLVVIRNHVKGIQKCFVAG